MSDWNERKRDDDGEGMPAVEGKRFYSLLFIAAALTFAGAIAGWVFGVRTGFIALKIGAIDLLAAFVSTLLCFHACRIRQRQQESRDWEKSRGGEQSPDVWDILRAKTVHFVLLAFPGFTAVGVLAFMQLSGGSAGESAAASSQSIAVGIVCLAVSCVWLVLSKAFLTIEEGQLPESFALGLIFREAQWITLAVAGGILAGILWSNVAVWVGWVIAVWLIALVVEQLVRSLIGWINKNRPGVFVSPLRLMIRDVVFLRGNPIASFFETVEERFGVSFRSSWAIRFVKRATIPAALLVLLLFWGLSTLAVVEINQLGIRESFGKPDPTPLQPGLHFKLPWPFGRVLRYPVKTISSVPVGFVIGESKTEWETALLWTKAHAKEEFNLSLGDGTEFVAVNAIVYFKIRETKTGLFNYAFQFSNPDEAMEAYAYRALVDWTRSATLEKILSVNRAEFAQNLEDSLRKYVEENDLGIDIIDLALISLHPPLEVGSDYLEVISARIDAERVQIEARGDRSRILAESESLGSTMIAEALQNGAQRVGAALEESSEFLSLGQGFAAAPEALKLRLWYEALEGVLSDKRLILVDKSFAEQPGGIMFDQRPNPLDIDVLQQK